MAWAEEQWKNDGVEDAGAVYDQDEMYQEFCARVDACCSKPISDDIEIPMCGGCEVDVTEDVDKDMFDSCSGSTG